MTCAVLGAGGAVVFQFVFPGGAISTLMHQVLHLPGPGAGIAVIIGPFAIMIATIACFLKPGAGRAFIASLTFVLMQILLSKLLVGSSNSKGMLGSPLFIAAVSIMGLMMELSLILTRKLGPVWRSIIAGSSANVALLVFCWTVIFPRTNGWIQLGSIPILMGLCLVFGLFFGYLGWLISRPLSKVLAPQQYKE